MKRDKLDALFSKMIRRRDRFTCQRCGAVHASNSAGLHCSHNVPRRYQRLRFTPANAIALCFPCHQWYGGEPYESGAWLAEYLGPDAHKELMAMKAESFRSSRPTKELIYGVMKEDAKSQETDVDHPLRDPIGVLRDRGLL